MQKRTLVILSLAFLALLWWTVTQTIENLEHPKENDIAGTRIVDGKTQCYFYNDPDTYEVEYWDHASRYFTAIKGSGRTYTLDEIGVSFQLPAEYNYYVFQQKSLSSRDEYHDITLMPFSDAGCVSAFLHNSISAQNTPLPGMPGGEPIKEPNPKVIVKQKEFGGRVFEKHTIPNDTMPPYHTYYYDHAGLYYFFTTGRTTEDTFVMEEILKSLKFLDEK